jgi:shikimate kinase
VRWVAARTEGGRKRESEVAGTVAASSEAVVAAGGEVALQTWKEEREMQE